MTTRSFLTGVVGGAAAGIAGIAATRAFGHAPDARIALLLEALVAFSAGLLVPSEPGARFGGVRIPPAPSPRISAAALAILAALISWGAVPLGHAVLWAGGNLGAGPLALGVARALVAAPFVLPGAWFLGALARPPSEASISPRAGAAPIAGLSLGFLAITLLVEFPGGLALAGSLVALAFAAIAWRSGSRLAPSRESMPPLAGLRALLGSPVLPAVGIGVAIAVGDFLAPRLLTFTAGNDLSGIPVASLLLLAGIAAGALAAVVVASLVPFRPASLACFALFAAALVMLCFWSRFDGLVPRFAEWAATDLPLAELLANASRSVSPLVLSFGALLGFAASTLARESRESGPLRVLAAASLFAGFLGGHVLLATTLPSFRLEGAIDAGGVSFGLLAALGFALADRVTILRLLPALLGAGAVLFAVRATPPIDRNALLVERGLMPPGSFVERAQKNWLVFDEDGRVASTAIVRRGQARRILVNGRRDNSNESVKSHGLLAHLPLLLHRAPRSAIVIGSGNGLALAAALSHSIERLECFETDAVSARATAMCGAEAERAMRDGRLAIRFGDPTDLLARAPVVDVILSQSSGAWNERSADVSTREFLQLASRRLGPDGLLCQWVPDSALTKEGIRILFATFADVFPDVQAWSGQGGDLLILARRAESPIDASVVLERFRSCGCEASRRASWVLDPVTFLSNFLASDATVRRVSAGAAIHEIERPRLGREETARRRLAGTVNPVPGLAELGDDITSVIGGEPVPGLVEAARRGAEARRLERVGANFHAERRTFEAIEAYQRALEINPLDGSLRRSMAMLRTRLGIQYAQDNSMLAAHNNMRAAIEVDTTYAQGFANLGMLLIELGPPDYALSTTHRAVVLAPDDDLSWAQLGVIRRRQGNLQAAIGYLEKSLELNPRNLEAASEYVYAKTEMETNPDFAWAIKYLEGFVAENPDNEPLLYQIGKLRDAMRRSGSTPPSNVSEDAGAPANDTDTTTAP